MTMRIGHKPLARRVGQLEAQANATANTFDMSDVDVVMALSENPLLFVRPEEGPLGRVHEVFDRMGWPWRLSTPPSPIPVPRERLRARSRARV